MVRGTAPQHRRALSGPGGGYEFNGNASQAFLTVDDEHCSLAMTSSHGRSGLSRMFLGSVALKTVTLAHAPELVDHTTPEEIAVGESLMQEYANSS